MDSGLLFRSSKLKEKNKNKTKTVKLTRLIDMLLLWILMLVVLGYIWKSNTVPRVLNEISGVSLE